MRLPNIISLAVISLLAVNYFAPLADLDWSWQVRTGQRIVETGSLRTPDTFSYTIDGKVVHDFEWLWEVLLWHAWNLFGMGGLKFLRIVVVAAPLALLGWRLYRDKVRWHVIVLALVAAFYVVSPAWNLRPLYATTIGLFLAWSLLHDHCTGRQRLSWWALPLVMLVWGNMHPGVITGQALILGAIAWEWFYALVVARFTDYKPDAQATDSFACASGLWRSRNPVASAKDLDRPALWRLTIVGALALASSCLSPDPWERLLYPFSPDLKHPIFRIFIEMQPLHRFLFRQPVVAPVVYATAALVLLSIVKRFRHYRVWELALLAGLALLGSVAVRSLMDWYVVMLAIGVPHVTAMYVDAVRSNRRREWLYALVRLDNGLKRVCASRWFRWQPVWPAACIGVLFAISLVRPLSPHLPGQNGPDWPVAALDHIERAGIAGNFFTPPDYGAYVGWRLKERAKTYMDTRGFFFPPELVEDSCYVPSLGPKWRKRLDRALDDYPTEYFLLETWGVRSALWKALEPHVAQPLYVDDKAVLLTAAQVRQALPALDAAQAAR